jgi:TRAP-type C4-dicarboxylate transport system permease small subunit
MTTEDPTLAPAAEEAHQNSSRPITVLHAVASAVLVLMMLHILANVVSRKFFGHSLPNTLEISQYYYLPMLAMLGMVAAQHRNEHITAEMFSGRFSRRELRITEVGADLVCAAVSFAIVYYSFDRALYGLDVKLVLGVTNLQMWPMLFVIPICFAVMGLQLLVGAYKALKQPVHPHDRGLAVTVTE